MLDHQIHDNHTPRRLIIKYKCRRPSHTHLDKRDLYPIPNLDKKRICLCQGRLVNITGDVLLASGVVAYLGAFDARYRKTMISDWQVMMMIIIKIMIKTSVFQALCKSQRIPCSNEFSLTNTLGDQVVIIINRRVYQILVKKQFLRWQAFGSFCLWGLLSLITKFMLISMKIEGTCLPN